MKHNTEVYPFSSLSVDEDILYQVALTFFNSVPSKEPFSDLTPLANENAVRPRSATAVAMRQMHCASPPPIAPSCEPAGVPNGRAD